MYQACKSDLEKIEIWHFWGDSRYILTELRLFGGFIALI